MISEEGEYYPLKEITEKDTYNINDVKYIGKADIYSEENCELSSEYYKLEKKITREYSMPENASYALIENINDANNIKIYYDNKQVNFSVISSENNKLKINLKNPRMCDKLIFYVNSDNSYKISLYKDLGFRKCIISKDNINEQIAIPDETWIIENTKYTTQVTEEKMNENSLVTLKKESTECAYKEKYVFKYNTTKEYYDDNYHLYVEGYNKDVDDYKFYYKGEPIINFVEIISEKITEIPKIEYVYTEKDKNELDSSKEYVQEINTKVITNTKTIEKEIPKVPKVIYIIILLLVSVIIVLIIKIYRKYVE